MGDRGNIKITDGQSTVFLYTHWKGSALPNIVKRTMASQRARNRWGNGSYLARILFDDLLDGDRGESGAGISSVIGDGDDQVLHINVDRQYVTWRDGKPKTFAAFAGK